MVQEYGRYFGMKTCCLARRLPDRPKPQRRRTAWLPCRTSIKAATSKAVSIRFSVTRANRFATTFIRSTLPDSSTLSQRAPRCGEVVYNIGGGRANSVSIPEAFERATAWSGKK